MDFEKRTSKIFIKRKNSFTKAKKKNLQDVVVWVLLDDKKEEEKNGDFKIIFELTWI